MTFYIHFMYFIPLCLIVYFLKVPFSYSIPAEDRDQTVDDAWAYLPWMMASSIFAIQLECFKSYLIAYEIFTPFIFIHFSTTGLHFLWCWLFMSHWNYGIDGAGFAIMLTEVKIFQQPIRFSTTFFFWFVFWPQIGVLILLLEFL